MNRLWYSTKIWIMTLVFNAIACILLKIPATLFIIVFSTATIVYFITMLALYSTIRRK